MSGLESFIVAPDHVDGGQLSITGPELHHLRKVKRKRPGDLIVATDGAGNFYRVKLLRYGRSAAICEILKISRRVGEAAHAITLVQGMMKSQRMDWLIEKGTELGVARFIPVRTAYSGTDPAQIKMRRWQRLSREAVKQCGRSVFPEIEPMQDLTALLDKLRGTVWFAHPRTTGATAAASGGRGNASGPAPRKKRERIDASPPPTGRRNAAPAGQAMTLLVGPEGGFSDEEVQACHDAGFTQVSLGTRRLRAETAGLAMVTLALQAQGEL